MSPAYFETHFQLEGSDANWPSEFAIVTAYSTTGETWSPERNSAADKDLAAELAATGVWRRRITGYSPSTGHAEPGWAVELSVDRACDLGLRYKQDAIYYVTGDKLWVTFCDDRRQLVAAADRPGRIELAASVYVHEENLNWTQHLFSTAVAMQAAEAAFVAGQLPEKLSSALRPVTSAHPRSGPRAEMDEVLDIFKNFVNPEGQGPSRYASEEMEQLVATLQRPPCVAATGDTEGLAAEFPYPGGTSLLQLSTREKDPRAGNGLFAQLTLPEGKDDAATARQALECNKTELSSMTPAHFLGSWCTSEMGLTFATFYPNCVHRKGCLENIAMTHAARARWLTEEVMGYSWEEHFEEAFERKMAQVRLVSDALKTAAESPKKRVLPRKVFGRRSKRE